MKKDIFNFIKKLTIIAIPIIIQQFFLNIASLLDTMMVGKLDNASVSGVFIANQIIFVMNLLIFGATEGGSIFFSQFYGSKDKKYMTQCFSFKLLMSFILALICIIVALTCNKQLVLLFTNDEAEIIIACKYLKLITIQLIPYAITSSISTCLRESHKTVLPMIITGIGAIINFGVNFILIFGYLNMPKMGATGAAVGTIVERFFEMIILIIFIIFKKYDFVYDIKNNIKVDKNLFSKLIVRSIPLILNEGLWALGQTMLVFIFNKNDPIATVALPIATTIYNLIFVVCLGFGQSITILIGNLLGEGKNKESKQKSYISMAYSLIVGIVLGCILTILAPVISSSYTGLEENVRQLGKYLIYVYSIYVIICSCNNSFFFIIRSGGKSIIVILFDSFYSWGIQIPLSFLLLKITNLPLIYFVMVVYAIDLLKFVAGFFLIISGKWIKNLTNISNNNQIKHSID
ncbi:MAG: MATE family efflux transporter [Bacillales bacterium]|nr:MATE family efflux transporter [Bacillales bacterium]